MFFESRSTICTQNLHIISGLFTPQTRPEPIRKLYESAEKIPNIHIMDEFRDDDKNCRTLYSDEGFFFEILKEHILKLWEEEKQLIRKERKKQKRTQKAAPLVIRRRPVCILFIFRAKLRNTLN